MDRRVCEARAGLCRQAHRADYVLHVVVGGGGACNVADAGPAALGNPGPGPWPFSQV